MEELNGKMGPYSWIGGINNLARRKQADLSEKGGAQLLPSSDSDPKLNKLARELSIPELIAIGVGSTIAAGVYVLVGTVAREQLGPALTLCFLIAGVAAALSAFCCFSWLVVAFKAADSQTVKMR